MSMHTDQYQLKISIFQKDDSFVEKAKMSQDSMMEIIQL